MHFLARPHVFTLLLAVDFDGMIEADRRGANPRAALVAGSDHIRLDQSARRIPGADRGAGPGGRRGRSRSLAPASARRAPRLGSGPALGKLTAACAAVSLVNPYGWDLHRHVIEYLRSDWIRNVVQEFQSPSFRNENMLQFEALLLIGLITAGARFRRGQVVEGCGSWLWATWRFRACATFRSSSRSPAPMIAVEVTSWWKAGWAMRPRNRRWDSEPDGPRMCPGFQRTSVWLVVAVAALALSGSPITWPRIFPLSVPDRDGARPRAGDSAGPRADHRPVGGLPDLPASRSRRCSSTAAAIFTARRSATSFCT